MSSQELLAEFGKPIEIEHQTDGHQDWFYRFASSDSWSGPAKGWDTEKYDPQEVTSAVYFEKAAIRLSPSLKVTGEIPAGKVIKRQR
ncbi:MAG: hypothetical protein ACR2RV_16605 [Verrucomicrobiales bacterium]